MPGEFEFINNLKSRYGLDKIGDDCAVLPKDDLTDQLLTTDMLIEDIDFRLGWTTPEFLGHKALAVSLSDIAAMGGDPTWAMLSIGVPENLWNSDFLDRLYDGWHALAQEFGVELVGGDVSRSPDKLVIDSIVGGQVGKGKAILRSTAKEGNRIFVSGKLGSAAGGLHLLENGQRYSDQDTGEITKLLRKQLKPQPQVMLSNIMQELAIATSMIDLSDGLSSDLSHLCTLGHLGARIEAQKLPIAAGLKAKFPADDCFQMALHGGEDFELLFTVDKKNISLLKKLPVTQIGEITANVGVIELIIGGETRILEPKGYRHF